jgi:hypothetical protein
MLAVAKQEAAVAASVKADAFFKYGVALGDVMSPAPDTVAEIDRRRQVVVDMATAMEARFPTPNDVTHVREGTAPVLQRLAELRARCGDSSATDLSRAARRRLLRMENGKAG